MYECFVGMGAVSDERRKSNLAIFTHIMVPRVFMYFVMIDLAFSPRMVNFAIPFRRNGGKD